MPPNLLEVQEDDEMLEENSDIDDTDWDMMDVDE